jgi:Arc/MetJ-type ribon-helix-helix transcriptional regulator
MRATQSLNITLPTEMVELVQAKVASGEYASASEVVVEGLLSLSSAQATLDAQQIEEVLRTLEKVRAHPERLMSLEEVDRRLDARLEALRQAEGER